ncbi:uncharacterized protein L3040_001655 [Drepanopeziza brunnea f. sp. 'multigermtubi']|uniref:uncharacterized protein n=1 Tax=Drepanopeziza brunnea f. sp. 'multigermtubi' TaxID=698441 RepID=UPI002388987E|nr:hypothetical protein L3040_001655 [Drepanopeziza brunnea f. sp. 'multigermtubi']
MLQHSTSTSCSLGSSFFQILSLLTAAANLVHALEAVPAITTTNNGSYAKLLPEPEYKILAPQLAARGGEMADAGFADDAQFQSQLVSDHVWYRAQHGAGPVTWSDELARSSSTWIENCKFGHSGTPGVGENIALGYSKLVDAVNAWGLERVNYDFAAPGFSSGTGHFSTQMVWKATTKIGCAKKQCTVPGFGNGGPAWYLVCQYSAQGNIVNAGFFETNVGRQVSGDPKVGIVGTLPVVVPPSPTTVAKPPPLPSSQTQTHATTTTPAPAPANPPVVTVTITKTVVGVGLGPEVPTPSPPSSHSHSATAASKPTFKPGHSSLGFDDARANEEAKAATSTTPSSSSTSVSYPPFIPFILGKSEAARSVNSSSSHRKKGNALAGFVGLFLGF